MLKGTAPAGKLSQLETKIRNAEIGQLCDVGFVGPKAQCSSTNCASQFGTMPGDVHRKKTSTSTSCRACRSLVDAAWFGRLTAACFIPG